MATRKEKQQWAQELYTKMGYNKKAVADKVGITPKTMADWVDKYGWDDLRASYSITRESQLKNLYAQVNALNDSIGEREKKFPDSKEADILAKLTTSIRNLENESTVADNITTFMEFSNWLKSVDLPKAKEFIRLQDAFIKHKLTGK